MSAKLYLFSFIFLATTGAAYAVDSGTVTYSAILTTQSCNATGSDQNVAVDFGTLPISTLATPGSSTIEKDFNIVLSDCPTVINTPSVAFSGTTSGTSAGASVFSNIAAGGATNVGGVIHDIDGSGFVGGEKKVPTGSTNNGGKITLPFKAKIISTGSGAVVGTTDGAVSIPITFNISYN